MNATARSPIPVGCETDRTSERCGCGETRTFTCETCKRAVFWCAGADDEMPAACDECWTAQNPASELICIGPGATFCDTNIAARDRVRRAMRHVEAAQNLIDEAAREICPIVGGVQQWTALGTLHATIKKRWSALDRWLRRTGSKLDLDATAKAFIAKNGRQP